MATIGQLNPTLWDCAKVLDPDGKIAKIVEVLTQTNEILEDAVWKEGNLPTGHRTTIRTGLPSVYWRLLNQGIPPSKSSTAQVDEGTAMLEALSEVDTRLLELNAGNAAAYRLTEDMAFMESMNQTMAQTLIYGSSVNPASFVGLAPRYGTRVNTVPNHVNVLHGGGAGTDNTSIWLIGWGDSTVHCIYPKGSTAGFQANDEGEDWTTDATGGRYKVARTHYKWDCGLVVQDWRYAVRIANIDKSDLIALTGTQALTAATNVIRLMIRSIDRLPSTRNCRPAFYVSRDVASMLRIHAMEKTSNVLSIQPGVSQFGQDIFTLRLLGIPIRVVDTLAADEALVPNS